MTEASNRRVKVKTCATYFQIINKQGKRPCKIMQILSRGVF